MKLPTKSSSRWVLIVAAFSLNLLYGQSDERPNEAQVKTLGSIPSSFVDQATSAAKQERSVVVVPKDARKAQAGVDEAKLSDNVKHACPSKDLKPAGKSALEQQVNRGFFIDFVAAIFGVLSVVFALITLVAAIFGFVFGVSKFKELISKIENEITEKVDFEFKKKLDVVVEEQIKPKVESIITTNLKEVLEAAHDRIKTEISKTVSDADLKEELIKVVTSEIQSRLAYPSAASVAPKEFEG